MSKKSKKAKKNSKPRQIFVCPKCHAYWVHDYYHECAVCGTVGEPQNESAVRLLRWRLSDGHQPQAHGDDEVLLALRV